MGVNYILLPYDVLRHPSPESSQQSAPQEQIQQQDQEQHIAEQEAEPLLEVGVIGRGIYTLPVQTCACRYNL